MQCIKFAIYSYTNVECFINKNTYLRYKTYIHFFLNYIHFFLYNYKKIYMKATNCNFKQKKNIIVF